MQKILGVLNNKLNQARGQDERGIDDTSLEIRALSLLQVLHKKLVTLSIQDMDDTLTR